jgi:hypothetical protein
VLYKLVKAKEDFSMLILTCYEYLMVARVVMVFPS